MSDSPTRDWGTVQVGRFTRSAYRRADGSIMVGHREGWAVATAGQAARFTIDLGKTVSLAHTDALYEALRLTEPGTAEAAGLRRQIAAAHGW